MSVCNMSVDRYKNMQQCKNALMLTTVNVEKAGYFNDNLKIQIGHETIINTSPCYDANQGSKPMLGTI